MPTNRDIQAMLSELIELSILEEESPQSFKVRAYENALLGIQGHQGELSGLSAAELSGIKGVGKSTADKIREFVDTGSVRKLAELRDKYPPAFVQLTKIPGLGPKTLKLIRRELGVENLEGLRQAIAEERLRALPGLGPTREEKIARSIERLGLHGKDHRTPIAEAMPVALQFIDELRRLPGVEHAVYCGSLRRHAETIGDVDITVASLVPEPVMEAVASHAAAGEVIGHGVTKTSVVTHTGLQVDVRVVEPGQLGAALLYFTGSKAHNIALRQRAIERGWLLNEYGLFSGEDLIAAATEEEIYAALDLAFIPPPLRENKGEIEAAATDALPDLVQSSDIKGDLHYHTDRSGDGRSSLREMVTAAAARGYEYLAITDHGEDLAINGSSRDELLAHREAIGRLAPEFPGLRLLFGCELNIGPDGKLDYDEDFRRNFEWAVASVHSHFDLPQARQTERIIRAAADPAVTAIGHLSGRYIGRRPGIDLDLDVVFDALRSFGTALEVNGALDRLDASSEVIRAAVAAGVALVISTDSHHTSELGRMEYGVRNAQRGWAPKASVLNTLPASEFLARVEDRW
jgi:DNA polymerase (family 10)